ncbi:MAG: kinase/pyrophosphorylase [Deltaproteobacteria bacterium]|nr:kinase/pyrophosphorylase [Deltaproteobacteria bacterium]
MKSTAAKKFIYLIGEGTGEMITRIAKASLAQFSREKVEVLTFFLVRDKKKVARILKKAEKQEALLAFSIIEPELRDFLIREAEKGGIKAIDVIGNFILQLSIFLGEKPMAIPGRQYVLDEDYFRRIEAINFAVKHDDGKNPQGLKLADLVLVGLSRTGKTPLSTYLANKGWNVANIPLHPDLDPPEELFQIDQQRVFGLIVTVEGLVKFREARLAQLGLEAQARYADPVAVADEIDWCREFYRQHPLWEVINISNQAIEEITAGLLSAYNSKRPF